MTLVNHVTIKSKNGMHLRPAGVLSQIASKNDYYDIGIFLLYDGIRADAKSVFNLMGLGAFYGASLVLEIEYDEKDADIAHKAFDDLSEFFDSGYQNAEVPDDSK